MSVEKRVGSGLAGELRFLRKERKLTLQVVCDQLRWPQSKISRMETGQQGVTLADLASLLTVYDVFGKERERLLHMVDRQDDPGYWETDVSPTGSRTLARLEPEATAIVDVEPLLVPGLAQTAAYAAAVMKAAHLPPEQVGPRVAARMARKKILAKKVPPKLDMVVDEIALRRVVGSHSIMAEQLRAMIAVAKRPNVRLWVVPFDLGGNAGLHYPFYLMDFLHAKSIVLLEGTTSGVFLEDDERIGIFRRHAAELVRVALSPNESVHLVATLVGEHERECGDDERQDLAEVELQRCERELRGVGGVRGGAGR